MFGTLLVAALVALVVSGLSIPFAGRLQVMDRPGEPEFDSREAHPGSLTAQWRGLCDVWG